MYLIKISSLALESEVVEVEEDNSNDVKSEVDDGDDSDVKIEEEIICESSSNNNKSTNRLQVQNQMSPKICCPLENLFAE